MRPAEPLEPEVLAALEAIDAAVHDEPVDPELADLAELALILRDERPEPDAAFVDRLDDRVAQRFERDRPGRARGRRWLMGGGSAVAAVAAAVALVVVLPRGGASSSSSGGASSSSSSAQAAAAATTSGSATSGSAASGSAASGSAASGSVASSAGGSGASSAHGSPAAPKGAAPVPRSGPHRQVVQSAQLALSASPGRIDTVAQQVFDVVGAERGIVSRSAVDAHSRGASTARFSLQVPSPRLGQTLTRLSRLRGAHVTSRSDASSDVTGQVGAGGRRLAQAQALQRSLLRQLAAATTTQAVDSLKAQLRSDGRAIAREQTALAGLHRRVSYSTISVSIVAPAPSAPHRSRGGGGFTLHRALHDAGRVLVVAAGVALIALAVLVPLGIVVALLLWGWTVLAHRRRESALGP